MADSESTANTRNSFFSVDTKAEADFSIAKASAGFNMSTSQASAVNQGTIRATMSYVFSGQFLELQYADDEVYFSCMSPSFQRAYEHLVTAGSSEEFLKQYIRFTRIYGNGCVTKLYLTSGSAAEIAITSSNAAESSANKFGASLAVGVPQGGVSAATAWGKEMKDATRGVSVRVTVDSIPENTPTLSWVKEVVSRFQNIGIDELTKPATFTSLPADFEVNAPDLPKPKKPDKKTIPERTADENYQQSLKKALLEADKFEGDWEKYIGAQREAAESVSAEAVNEEHLDLIVEEDANPDHPEHDEVVEGLDDEAPQQRMMAKATADANVWDLGGYIPCNYEITPWETLFPEIGIRLFSSFSTINVARAHTFYYTRLQFAQYLYFLNEVGARLCGNKNIDRDADLFLAYCRNFLTRVEEVFSHDRVSNASYRELVVGFNRGLEHLNGFSSQRVYDAFFKFYGFFSRYPYGFLFLCSPPGDQTKFFHSNRERGVSRTHLLEEASLYTMLESAVRVYPVINNWGRLTLASFVSNDGQEPGWTDYITRAVLNRGGKETEAHFAFDLGGEMDPLSHIDLFIKQVVEPGIYHPDPKNPEQYAFWMLGEAHKYFTLHFKGIGFDDIPRNKPDFRIRGKAMWENFPFERVRNSLLRAIPAVGT